MKHERESSGGSVNPEKKQKTDDDDGQQDKKFSTDIRTAFDLNLAFSRVQSKFEPVGKVVTVWQFKDYPAPNEKEQRTLDSLSEVNQEANKISQSYCFGNLDTQFYLKVTHPGCEFKKTNLRFDEVNHFYDVEKDIIQKWLESAPVSGFGDNKALETKMDPDVRKASEIPAEGFKVKQALLNTIANIWSKNFLPADVRVEPYKIHIYGKGGHFKSHRDTPEKLLVGTFLLGIGDSTASGLEDDSDDHCDRATSTGNFRIGNIRRTANAGQWVAFHPDVPHSVEPLTHGCRAAIAFKIFSLEDVDIMHEAAQRYPSIVERAKAVLTDLKGPFGIILQHQYPMGTDENGLIGVDAVLLTAVKQVRPSNVKVIPVVVWIHEERMYDEESSIEASVYPFTRHHVDICLGRADENTREAVAWIKDAKDVPFYSWDFKKNSMRWSSEEEEINHTGNESDGTRETSLYMAYAVVVM
ncbi:hypothetical protein L218DRAFT_931194 [Marasmius fiardii PR-910]|nr:hypothetical protein L218DRAFT_931194 [Marasmius fiardii PR-910]